MFQVLLVDYDHQRLISCGSVYHGHCERHHLDDIRLLDEHSNDSKEFPVLSNNHTISVVAFIAPGPSPAPGEPQPNVLYVGLTWSGQDVSA